MGKCSSKNQENTFKKYRILDPRDKSQYITNPGSFISVFTSNILQSQLRNYIDLSSIISARLCIDNCEDLIECIQLLYEQITMIEDDIILYSNEYYLMDLIQSIKEEVFVRVLKKFMSTRKDNETPQNLIVKRELCIQIITALVNCYQSIKFHSIYLLPDPSEKWWVKEKSDDDFEEIRSELVDMINKILIYFKAYKRSNTAMLELLIERKEKDFKTIDHPEVVIQTSFDRDKYINRYLENLYDNTLETAKSIARTRPSDEVQISDLSHTVAKTSDLEAPNNKEDISELFANFPSIQFEMFETPDICKQYAIEPRILNHRKFLR